VVAKVKLHRCPVTWYKAESHGCWLVQNALEEQGIEVELVKSPVLPRSRRKDVIRLTGQQLIPVIEFADGAGYRAESSEMAARIRAGKLFEGGGGNTV
jgi:glutathione S-transferase